MVVLEPAIPLSEVTEKVAVVKVIFYEASVFSQIPKNIIKVLVFLYLGVVRGKVEELVGNDGGNDFIVAFPSTNPVSLCSRDTNPTLKHLHSPSSTSLQIYLCFCTFGAAVRVTVLLWLIRNIKKQLTTTFLYFGAVL